LDALPKTVDKTGFQAAEALKMIAELYAVESKLKEKWGGILNEIAAPAICVWRWNTASMKSKNSGFFSPTPFARLITTGRNGRFSRS